jgi:hypothetical protein
MYQFNQAKRLEGKPFSLAGRGRSPAAGVPCDPSTLATPLSTSPREQYPQLLYHAVTVAQQP